MRMLVGYQPNLCFADFCQQERYLVWHFLPIFPSSLWAKCLETTLGTLHPGLGKSHLPEPDPYSGYEFKSHSSFFAPTAQLSVTVRLNLLIHILPPQTDCNLWRKECSWYIRGAHFICNKTHNRPLNLSESERSIRGKIVLVLVYRHSQCMKNNGFICCSFIQTCTECLVFGVASEATHSSSCR